MAILKTNILSRCLGRQVDFNVILPTFQLAHAAKGINPYEPKEFKVLVLLHGFSGDCNDYLTFSNVVRYAEKHNLAIIMPSGCNSGYTDDLEGAKYHSFIAYELLEVCRFMFPLSSKREDTYIGGLSMGAMGAAKIALAHPEIFSEVLMMSGAPLPLSDKKHVLSWFGKDNKYYSGALPGYTLEYKETQEDAYYNAKQNVLEHKPLPRFMVTVGLKDFMLQPCQLFYNTLSKMGYDVIMSEIPDYGHEWDFWDQQLKEAIHHFFTL